jgi:arsenate reductase (thioredoxin)
MDYGVNKMDKKPVDVLFICVHNSARSQMAETFLNDLGKGRFKAVSAGLEPGTLNPLVVKAMAELGYDISGNSTNSVFDYAKEGRSFDIVVAVCSKEAQERCPIFPGKGTRLHWPFDDPSSLSGSEEERLAETRRIRDDIKTKIIEFIAEYS